MPWNDLREYLEALEGADDVLRITEAVEPELEIGAVWAILTREQGPVALHERGTVRGYPDWAIATNLFGNFERVARALQIPEDELFAYVRDRMAATIEPTVVDDGPVNENVYEGAEVDLTAQLPNITWNERDAGPYLTAGHCVLEDPEYGTNTAWYRIQLLGPQRIAIRLAPHHQGGIIAKRAKARDETELDVAVYAGGDPASMIATAAGIAMGADEYDLAGSLRQEPLELVRCATVDRLVPARAELLLEGKIRLEETVAEGPFGEFCGTYSGAYEEHPIDVTRVAHRDEPVMVGTAESKPINETHVLQSLFKSINLRENLEPLLPEIEDVYYPPESGGFFEAIVQLDSDLIRPGIPKNVLYSLVAGDSTAKWFLLVDDDIDIRDRDEIQWALTTRVQPGADIVTVPDGMTTQLDPSASADGVTDKVFIDATMAEGFRGDLITIEPAVRERAEAIITAARR